MSGLMGKTIFLNEFFFKVKDNKEEDLKFNEQAISYHIESYNQAVEYREKKFKNTDMLKYNDLPDYEMFILADYTETDVVQMARKIKKYEWFDMDNWTDYMEDFDTGELYEKEIRLMHQYDLVPIEENGGGDNVFISLRNYKIYSWDHEESPQIVFEPESGRNWKSYDDYIEKMKEIKSRDRDFMEALRRIKNNEI